MSGRGDRPLPLARLALALYPPAWRDRYGDEVLAMLAESGSGLRAAASLAGHALPAWICPPRHLLTDRWTRMRSSLGTVLIAWSILAGLSLAFAQLTQLQGAVPPLMDYVHGPSSATSVHLLTFTPTPYTSVVAWSYHVFDAALLVSALAVGFGGLPLWLVMLRRAGREDRRRDLARLLMPVLAPVAYLLALIVAVRLINRPDGVGPWYFLAVVLAGFAAAITAAAGPGFALRSMRPRGPAVRFASRAAALGVGSMLVAAIASGTAATALYLFARAPLPHPPGTVVYVSGMVSFRQYGSSAMLIAYLALVVAVAAVAAVSARRGARAALADHS